MEENAYKFSETEGAAMQPRPARKEMPSCSSTTKSVCFADVAERRATVKLGNSNHDLDLFNYMS